MSCHYCARKDLMGVMREYDMYGDPPATFRRECVPCKHHVAMHEKIQEEVKKLEKEKDSRCHCDQGTCSSCKGYDAQIKYVKNGGYGFGGPL